MAFFNNPNSSLDKILKSDEHYVLKMYGALNEEHFINNYCYFSFIQTFP